MCAVGTEASLSNQRLSGQATSISGEVPVCLREMPGAGASVVPHIDTFNQPGIEGFEQVSKQEKAGSEAAIVLEVQSLI